MLRYPHLLSAVMGGLMPLLAGCSQVYTEQDFPDINEVPKRPTLVSITDCAAEAAAFQKSYATAR